MMQTIQAKDMNEEQWNSFAKRYTEEIKMNDPKKSGSTGWKDLRNKFLSFYDTFKSKKFNFYILFDQQKKILGWFELIYAEKALCFFHGSFSLISIEAFHYLYKILDEYLKEIGNDEIYIVADTEKSTEYIKSSGAEFYDEPLISILRKEDLDIQLLKEICNRDTGNNLRLVLYNDIPDEIFTAYIDLGNEISGDKYEFHPKKSQDIMKEENLVKDIESINNSPDPYYMYALLDGNKLAAFCSVYIRDNGRVINHNGGLTTVGKKYRGKGLAKFLKANLYLKLLEEMPDFEYIITDTYPWNKYMYKINEALGFVPYIKKVRFRLTKDFLKNFIKE